MANKQRQYKPEETSVPRPTGIAQVERAVRPELMAFDLAGQRARDLEIIRLLTEILKAVSDGK